VICGVESSGTKIESQSLAMRLWLHGKITEERDQVTIEISTDEDRY
jgi:hypothetical protein